MKLFLSYPSPERLLAERLALALEAEGHDVFFDRSDLPSGEAYHQRLREAIEGADAMLFLVTPRAVAAGSYTLAELDIARARWRRPAGRVLPVMVAPTAMDTLPPYLGAVTVLQPRGDLVAETVTAVSRLRAGHGRRRTGLVAAALLAVVGAAAGAAWWAQQQAAEEARRADEGAASQALQLCLDGSVDTALRQLDALAARAAPAVLTAREDCALHGMREMRAVRGPDGLSRSFDEQVAVLAPVLLDGLGRSRGARAADLRAHLGWGEHLRGREGSGHTDPVPHWQRALADDPDNVYAHAMWGHRLLPGRVADAEAHFERALAGGRERAFVRRLQFGGSLGGGDAAAAYAVAVADAMRRGGEAVSDEQRGRLWNHAFDRLLDADARAALQARLPPADALATFEWLFGAGQVAAAAGPHGRFVHAMLQARAGQRDAARAAFEALLRAHAAGPALGWRVVDESRRALAALPR